MASIQIFLSAVSAEFGSYREALRRDLARPNVSVKVQEDFGAMGTETLDKLDAYIKECAAVFHLVGDMTGAIAQEPSVAAIRRRYPDFGQRFPVLAPILESGAPALSYTQWEAWLALYHGKPLIIAVPLDGAPRDAAYRYDSEQQTAQAAHLDHLASVERYPEIRFVNADRLALEAHRSSLQEILASAQDQKRTLVYYAFLLLAGLSAAGGMALSAERKLLTGEPLLSGPRLASDVLDALVGSLNFALVVLARFFGDVLGALSPKLWTEPGIAALTRLSIIVGALAIYLAACLVARSARSSARYTLPVLLAVPAVFLVYRLIDFDLAVNQIAKIIAPTPADDARGRELLDAFVCSRISKSDADRGKASFAAPRCDESLERFALRYDAESVTYAWVSFAAGMCSAVWVFLRIPGMPRDVPRGLALVYLIAVLVGLGNWYGRYRPSGSYPLASLSGEYAARKPEARDFIVQRGLRSTQLVRQIPEPCGASLVHREDMWEPRNVPSGVVTGEAGSYDLVGSILLSHRCPIVQSPRPSPGAEQ